MNTTTQIESDIAVIGGGLAAVCAALAAARCGADVVLIQDRPVLGGNASSEIGIGPSGALNKNPWSRETGIIEEILLQDAVANPWRGTGPAHLDLLLEALVENETGIRLFLNTAVHSIESEKAEESGYATRIHAALGWQLTTATNLRILAEYFIDCTGDAAVGALAGAEWRLGRESRSEFQEPLAPRQEDSRTLGSSILFRARDTGTSVPFDPPPGTPLITNPDDLGPGRWLHAPRGPVYGGFWWMEVGTPYNPLDDAEKIRQELYRQIFAVWNYLKNYSEHQAAFANFAIDWIGQVPGKRESRRLVGDVMVTENDCHKDPLWYDRICFSGWYIDLHTSGGVLNRKEPLQYAHIDSTYAGWINVAPFSLPLRACFSRTVENLWMAGRNISVSHVALGATRVMMTTASLGQAVGTAAAIAMADGLSPRATAVKESKALHAIQQQLLRDDMQLFEMPLVEADDIAGNAMVSAGSVAVLDLGGEPGEAETELSTAVAQILPLTEDTLSGISFFVRNCNSIATSLQFEIQQVGMIRQREAGAELTTVSKEVPPGYTGWLSFETRLKELKPGCYRLILHAAPGVFWRHAHRVPPGTHSQVLKETEDGGGDDQNRHFPIFRPENSEIPPYALWLNRHCSMTVRTDPVQRPYEPVNIINGFAWPYALPNLWISQPGRALPQHLTLQFDTPVRIARFAVVFDTDLNADLREGAPNCAEAWAVHGLCSGDWREIYAETGNWRRTREVLLDTSVTVAALRLEIRAVRGQADQLWRACPGTEGGATARVYAMRVYTAESN